MRALIHRSVMLLVIVNGESRSVLFSLVITRSLPEDAHQKERPAGHTVTVSNHVEMAQVSVALGPQLMRYVD